MATVSHHAMRRYPIGPTDSTSNIGSTAQSYYVASPQRVTTTTAAATKSTSIPQPTQDKSKKSWSQRLKLSKNEKILPTVDTDDYNINSASTLSKSMKYAESWLYGTVRGIPVPPVHGQQMFAQIPTEVAVMVCSCPEYLNGTKREMKKASICKKCKGSRLPLAPIGGTVRIRSNTAVVTTVPRGSAGTVRMPNSKSSRPSILDSLHDPYDLMRRSRLVSPELQPVQISYDKRTRAKSSSPSRNRSRNRNRKRSPSPNENSINKSNRSRSASRTRPKNEECWLDDSEPERTGRRSILRCDVNPYDLLSTNSHINEFAPMNDDDNFDLELSLHSKKYENLLKTLNNHNVATIAGQRVRFTGSRTPSVHDDNESLSYEHIEIKNSNKMKNDSKKATASSNPTNVQTITTPNTNHSHYDKFYDETLQQLNSLPKRPPRRKQDNNLDENESLKTSPKIDLALVTPTTLLHSISADGVSSPTNNSYNNNTNGGGGGSGSQQCNTIKSILKRPMSLPPLLQSSMILSQPSTNLKHSIDGKLSDSQQNSIQKYKSKFQTDKISGGNTNVNIVNNINMMKINNTKQQQQQQQNQHQHQQQQREKEKQRLSGSHFYLPLPARKKVQFLVENEIIDNNDDEDNHSFDDLVPKTYENNSVILNISENGNDSSHITIISPMLVDNKHSVTATVLGGISNTISVNDNIIVDNDVSKTVKINTVDDITTVADYVDHDVKLSKESNLCNLITYNTTTTTPSTEENFHLNNKHENNSITINGINGITGITATNEKDGIITEVTPQCQRTTLLHRSYSDRRIPSVQPINVMPQFNDTMALRQRCARGDSRVLFTVGDDLPLCIRPREPPPPPPPSTITSQCNNTCLDESDKKCIDETTPMRPPRQIIMRKNSTQDIVYDNNDADGYEDANSLEIPNIIVQNTNLDCDDHIYEDYYVNSSAAMNNKRDMSDSHNANTQGNNDKHVEKLHIVNDVNGPDKKWQQSINEVFQGSRIFGSKIPVNNLNKTVVRVAPLVVSRESSAIHRLEIKHDDEDDITMGQKKTSILISGDDCYSTVNVSDDTPIYQSSVVVNEVTASPGISNTSSNTVMICVSSPRTPEEELIYKNNKINSLLNGAILKSIIPIGENERSSCSVLSPSRGTTFVNVDYDDVVRNDLATEKAEEIKAALAEEELGRLLRDPVEAVRRNLVPHVCGKINDLTVSVSTVSTATTDVILRQKNSIDNSTADSTTKKINEKSSFIAKLLEDPTLGHLADGLENDLVAKLIENSLMRLKENRSNLDLSGTRDEENMSKLIDISLQKVQEERQRLENIKQHTLITTTTTTKTPPASSPSPSTPAPLSLTDTPQITTQPTEQKETTDQKQPSNRDSMSSGNSYGSANYEMYEFDNGGDLSDCYHSCSSELTTEDESNSTRSKFYQMLVDATLSEIEISTTADDDHHYESIRLNGDPIYEEINDVPPPLPLSPPPITCPDSDLDKKNNRSIFEGASKYDILSYLVDAKERGIVQEESYAYNFSNTSDIIIEEEGEKLSDLHQRQSSDLSSRISHLSNASDSSEETSLPTIANEKLIAHRKSSAEIERNDSGVGSETSKTSRSKFQSSPVSIIDKNSPIHLCEDCDGPVETQVTDSGVMYAPLVCRKCGKKRAERKEIITEVVETEEKYGRDLQIILEEFYQPMLVAGLLSQEQLSAIFLNTEELLENNQALAERMRDALDIAMEQGDDDLLTVNVGKLFIEAAPMLHAFENYCIRQAAASLLLANLEKEKELLRIFLRVSQMENTVLRRMNLNSFLMVPVQRVTKYPLLLARLFKVTPPQQEGRITLKQAQEKIELHLNHMNREAKDVPTKLWRRISSSSPGRRTSCEIDMINIKLRKMAVDVLEWNHDEVRFAIEGKLLFTQPTDNNWRKGRTIKLTPVNALLVTNGKPSPNYKADRALCEPLNFPRHTGIREASLLLVKEKCGRYTLFREPLYLDKCIVCTESDWDDYFEVQEISTKDTFIFKAEDGGRTKQWYSQLQYHAQGMGAWRKRRNALANIMINGMMMRS